MESTRNADLFDPERIPRQKLPDRPLVGETYPNGGSEFKVLALEEDGDIARVRNLKSGWVCRAHHPALYLMPSGRIELLWSYSTDGHFEEFL